MSRDVRYLESIVRYCGNIEEAIKIFGKDMEDLSENLHFQNDCAFILIQIGEVVKKLSSELTNKYPRTEWSNIAKLRDRITHNYESIELHMLFEIITDDIPLLKKDCEIILADLSAI
jgi:uncharacterized protein with HEPN domain